MELSNNIDGETVEPSTGKVFPRVCTLNGMTFMGCGVRTKFGFVKVYAVGTYVDSSATKDYFSVGGRQPSLEGIRRALLDPSFPRTIRIVMNRSVTVSTYTSTIINALRPRMGGIDLDKLEEFQAFNPAGNLVDGDVMEFVISNGDDIVCQSNSVGFLGRIKSNSFCKAICDVYYGDDPVSPLHKKEVVEGLKCLD